MLRFSLFFVLSLYILAFCDFTNAATYQQNYTQDSGVAQSFGFPLAYPPNLKQRWIIGNTDITKHLRIQFLSFDTEGYAGQDCDHNGDYVVIYTGETLNEIPNICDTDNEKNLPDFGMFCGQHEPGTGEHYISSSSMVIDFCSDANTQGKGFRFNWDSVTPDCGASFTLNQEAPQNYIMHSPNFPGAYPDASFCSWNIHNALSSTHSVQISFDSFETFAKIDTFVYDNVVIVDGSGFETMYNGKIGPMTPQFGGSVVKVRFQSYFNQNWPGFSITSTLVPTKFSCPYGQHKCTSGHQCIDYSKRCDGHFDCADSSDEQDPYCQAIRGCGQSKVQPNVTIPNNFIVNGSPAVPGSWPWMISIAKDGEQFCGGSLISPQWVVSAGHCLQGWPKDPSQFRVKTGFYHAGSHDSTETDIAPAEIWIHPKWDGALNGYDISLIRLSRPVPFPFNTWTNTICLPRPWEVVPDGQQCVTMGYGDTEGTGSQQVLNQLVVPVVAMSVCNDSQHYNGRLHDSQMCAGFEAGGAGPCGGDSGGSLACRRWDNRFAVQGMVSWGGGDGCAAPHFPTVFVRIAALLDFISDRMMLYDD
uniref:Uncharacterized protein n=1 Tax=Plectus sambesii TaxID=2011161 RepID=A0A914WSW7_9BILA